MLGRCANVFRLPEYCIKRQPENRLGIASAVRNAFKPLADNQMRWRHQRINRGGKRRKHNRSGFGGGVRFARAFVGNIDRGVHFFHAEYAVIRIGLGGVITPRIGEIKPCPLVGRYDTDVILNVLLMFCLRFCRSAAISEAMRRFFVSYDKNALTVPS